MPLHRKVHCIVIVDDSGSMYSGPYGKSFMFELRTKLDILADTVEGEKHLNTSMEFVVFSNTAFSDRRLRTLPTLSGCTNISSGFNEMHRMAVSSKCDHCLIIFVSDGADDRGNEDKIARLRCLPMDSTLITVAVGECFPTSLVVDTLRPSYHTFGGDSIPLVIELPTNQGSREEMESDVDWVALQLKGIIEAGGVLMQYTLEELELQPSVEAISTQCKLWYNACTVKAVSKMTTHDEKVALINETKDKFNRAEDLMKGLTALQSKPLPSNLRARRPLYILTSMREKLNNLLRQLEKGHRLECMSDEDKRKYLGLGNNEGRFFSRVLQYHSADFDTSLTSLTRFLTNHQPTAGDDNLMDDANICSWREYYEDAKENMDLFSGAKSLAGVLEVLPFVGRGVRLFSPQPECCQINPWALSSFVEELPMTLKGISTYDLHVKFSGELKLSSGSINCIIIGGGDLASPGIFCHMQTFSLLRNWMLYFNDIRLVGASMLVLYVLCNHPVKQEWHTEELSRARDICLLHTPETSRWWTSYVDVLKTVDFRKCLITESDKLEKFMTCPGLGKFMLGTWWLVDQGHEFSEQDLIDRCQAAVTELIGRRKLNQGVFFTVDRCDEAFKFEIDAAVFKRVDAAIRTQHFTAKGLSTLIRTELYPYIKCANDDLRAKTSVTFEPRLLMNLEFFRLSVRMVECFFKRLVSQKTGREWGGLTDEMLLRALMDASSNDNSYQRNHTCLYKNLSYEEIMQKMKVKLAGSGLKDDSQSILDMATEQVVSQLCEQHSGLPRSMPAEYVALYKEETGRDIAATWKLDDTGLSRIACCFPDCYLFLTIPPGDEKKQRGRIINHLQTYCQHSIPGLHRCVVQNATLPSDQIASLVRSGSKLRDPFLPRDVTRRLAKGFGVYGGVPRSFGTAEAYATRALEEAKEAYYWRIARAIEGATEEIGTNLERLIDKLKSSLAANDAWTYADFKATFDAKYAAL